MVSTQTFAAAALIAALAAIPQSARAHDFWIEPSRWFVEAGAAAEPTLRVGHVDEHAHWSGGPGRIVSFRRIGEGGVDDARTGLSYDAAKRRWSGSVSFDSPGVYALALETNDAISVLPPDKFNAYVAEEGLTPARRARASSGAQSAPGRERYSRRAKALIFVEGAAAEALPPLVGHVLELAPLESPYALAADEPLRLKVLFEGKPLAGASVKLESLTSALLPAQRVLSDGSGRVAFPIPKRGAWKASVVWTRPVADDPAAEFSTVFASLSFSFRD